MIQFTQIIYKPKLRHVMHKINTIFFTLVPTVISVLSPAKATTILETHTNQITTLLIGDIQQSIAHDTLKTYDAKPFVISKQQLNTSAATTYGHFATYGEMPTYGEYNDDGSAVQPQKIQGHNGGDLNTTDFLNNFWANWQYFRDDIKFKHNTALNTDYNILTLGTTNHPFILNNNMFRWGTFGGYIDHKQKLTHTSITGHGAFIGLYTGYKLKDFNISTLLNYGKTYNELKTPSQTIHDFKNTWTGAAIHSHYNLTIDNTFILQPELYIGYTWVKSADVYNIATTSNNMTNVYITPGLRAIKYITSGWTGSANVKHAINKYYGNQTYANEIKLENLDLDNYTEYGIALEKSIQRLHLAIQINRRDGGHTGWNSKTSFKYTF